MHLRAAYARLRRSSNVIFSTFGMTTDQFVLFTVLARKGVATQQELVRECYSDTATIGAMLSLLEAKGLITRTEHPRDGRARSVRLTRAGRRLAEDMRRSSSALRIDLAALFNQQELRKLTELLERIASALHPPARKTKTKTSPQSR
jgi:DNA-binding MarR family transcriptional regulator